MEGHNKNENHAAQAKRKIKSKEELNRNALDGRPDRSRVDAVPEADHAQTNHRRQHGETEQRVRTAEHGGRDEQQHGAVAVSGQGGAGQREGAGNQSSMKEKEPSVYVVARKIKTYLQHKE